MGARFRGEGVRGIEPGTALTARLFLVALLVGFLSGCASTGLPTEEERTAVGAGKKAIVLLRVQCTIENGQPYEPFSREVVDDNISFGMGSFRTGGEPERLPSLRFLSPESRKNGWTYFVLPPGTHYLAVYPPRRSDVFTYARLTKSAPRWRIDISEDARLVYAGTLHITGQSDPLIIGGRIMRSIQNDETSITNEEDLARTLSAEELPGSGEVRTVLLKLQEGPTILHAPLPSPTR